MAIRKRGDTWFIDYYDPEGKRIRKAFKQKKDAVAEHAKIISLIKEDRYLDVKRACTTTLSKLCDRYRENFYNQRSFKNNKARYLETFKEYFGADRLLDQIRFVDLETYRNQLRARPVAGHARSDAAVNREMACLAHLMRKAVEWQLLDHSPFDQGRTLMLKENNARLRFLTESEIASLLDACTPRLRPVVECALRTGMRKSEILTLRWAQVRNGFIYLDRTKTNEARQIPVSEALEAIFAGIRQIEHLRSEYVFTYRDIKRSFNAAVKRAGLVDFTFHDLRHSFASQVILQGGSIKDVQELLGHKSLTMTLRYSHLTQERKRAAVNLLGNLSPFRRKKAQKGKAAKTNGG